MVGVRVSVSSYEGISYGRHTSDEPLFLRITPCCNLDRYRIFYYCVRLNLQILIERTYHTCSRGTRSSFGADVEAVIISKVDVW